MSKRLLAIAVLVAVNVIWGINVAVVKGAVAEMSPFAFNAVRTTLSSLVLLPFGISAGLLKDLRSKWPVLLLGGLAGVAMTQTAYSISLSLAPGSIVSVLSALGPLALVIMAMVFLSERLARGGWIGLLIALLGVLFVLGLGPSELEANGVNTLIGAAIVLVGIIGWYAFPVIAKKMMVGQQPMAMAAGTTIAGSVILLAVFGVQQGISGEGVEWGNAAVAGIIYSALINNTAAFIALNWALKHLEGSRVGGLSYVQVVVGVVGSWVILGEEPGPSFFIGAILVLVGVYLVSRARISGGELERPRTAGELSLEA